MRLDERGGAHILDQEGCRDRMSGICEARKERRCRTHHQPPLMLATRARDFCKIEPIAATVRQAQQATERRSSVYRANHASQRARSSLGNRRVDRTRKNGDERMTRDSRRARYAYRTDMVRVRDSTAVRALCEPRTRDLSLGGRSKVVVRLDVLVCRPILRLDYWIIGLLGYWTCIANASAN